MHWHQRLGPRGSQVLVDGPLFMLDRIEGKPPIEIAARYPGALLVLPLEGSVSVGGDRLSPGNCALASSIEEIGLEADNVCLIARAGAA